MFDPRQLSVERKDLESEGREKLVEGSSKTGRGGGRGRQHIREYIDCSFAQPACLVLVE